MQRGTISDLRNPVQGFVWILAGTVMEILALWLIRIRSRPRNSGREWLACIVLALLILSAASFLSSTERTSFLEFRGRPTEYQRGSRAGGARSCYLLDFGGGIGVDRANWRLLNVCAARCGL